MDILLSHAPSLSAILILMAVSAFFSCCEAAFFSLTQADRSALQEGGRLARQVLKLTQKPEQLLNTILLCNLVVNLLAFTISTVMALRLQQAGRPDLAGMIAVGVLFGVILFCEVLPKTLGVVAPKFFAKLWSLPFSLIFRLMQPVLPMLQWTNILSRRLICPDFTAEPYLRVGDLERAVEMSGEDPSVLKREQRVLQNIVSLSDIRAEELMRPRSMIRIFRPPISFEQIMETLNGKLPKSGYCLLTEPDSDEVASVLSFTRLSARVMENAWEEQFEPIIYVPWSSSAAEAFDRLRQENRNVAVVVNEFGETMGILTLDDIVETIFTREQGRSRRLLDRMELKRIGPALWQVNGLTSLRRLRRKFGVSFSEYSSLTVGGLMREMLERLPQVGDLCQVHSLEFRIVEVSAENDLLIHLTANSPQSAPRA